MQGLGISTSWNLWPCDLFFKIPQMPFSLEIGTVFNWVNFLFMQKLIKSILCDQAGFLGHFKIIFDI